MRVELGPDLAGWVPEPLPETPPTATTRRWVSWFELAVLIAFAALSMWVVALDLWQVVANGGTWTGTDGLYLVDQMQYLAWVRDASHHLLASNLFLLHPTARDYFQPAIAISGGLTALGVAPWLSLLLWKPVAVLGSFFAVRAYVRRTVIGPEARFVALALGLFFGSFTIVYGSLSVVGDLLPSVLSWGYTFGLIALAAMLAALLCYERGRPGLAALLGALAAALHPWQGELLILIVLGSELTMWRARVRRPRLAPIALVVLGTAVPLAYYMLLGSLDHSWTLARENSKHSFSFGTVALALAPLALPAALGYRGRAESFTEVATRIWPLAALGIFILSATELSATPLHSFEGITVPLAVLAVNGVRRGMPTAPSFRRAALRRPVRRLIGADLALRELAAIPRSGLLGEGIRAEAPGYTADPGLAAPAIARNGAGAGAPAASVPRNGKHPPLSAARTRRWLAPSGSGRWLRPAGTRRRRVLVLLAVLAATVPATAYELAGSAKLVAPAGGNANFVNADEQRALQYLERDPQPGGVLARFYLGAIVPAETGRRTFVGNCLWSEPQCSEHSKLAQALLMATMAPQAERAIVELIGARFVLADCQTSPSLYRILAPITVAFHRFGCASVYEVGAPRLGSDGPLTESAGHAAVRPPRRQ